MQNLTEKPYKGFRQIFSHILHQVSRSHISLAVLHQSTTTILFRKDKYKNQINSVVF